MPIATDLPMDKECLFSGLPMATCSHCRGDVVEDLSYVRDGDYEVTRIFEAQFAGTCTIVRSHKIKRGDKVGYVRNADNPYVPVPGVACKNCVRDLPRARS